MLEVYDRRPVNRHVPYAVRALHTFTAQEKDELSERLRVGTNPYADYRRYLTEIRKLVESGVPAILRDLCEAAKNRDLAKDPVVLLKNCPTGRVPMLDFEDPLSSKYERKKDFIAEAFLSVVAELLGTTVVTYKTANHGDMFHDIHPVKKLEFTITQKTVNTLHFHSDLPNNKVRPDWVYLLSMRNSPQNEVYTPIVRNLDVLDELDGEVVELLRSPLFVAPKPVVNGNISNYGLADAGYTDPQPIVFERNGHTIIACHEGCTTSHEAAGKDAIKALNDVMHSVKYDLFLEEGDFAAISNNACLHARHVVKIRDMEAHRHRWLLKTWNVDDPESVRAHFIPGKLYTADE